MELCDEISPNGMKCPAFAEIGAKCRAHASTATRVPVRKNAPIVYCARCGHEIKPSHWQKRTKDGSVHAGYQCEEKQKAAVG